MFLHPVFRTLVSRPELLAEHAGAYGELIAAEVGDVASDLQHRAVWSAAAAACGALGAGLAGVAVLLVAALPMDQMPAPWALALAPAVPLAAAYGFWRSARRRALDLGFPTLRQQLAVDRALWAQMGQERA